MRMGRKPVHRLAHQLEGALNREILRLWELDQ